MESTLERCKVCANVLRFICIIHLPSCAKTKRLYHLFNYLLRSFSIRFTLINAITSQAPFVHIPNTHIQVTLSATAHQTIIIFDFLKINRKIISRFDSRHSFPFRCIFSPIENRTAHILLCNVDMICVASFLHKQRKIKIMLNLLTRLCRMQ